MLTPDEDKFVVYLKQFDPCTAEPLPQGKAHSSGRLIALIAGTAAILVVTSFVVHFRDTVPHPPQMIERNARSERLISSQLLTLRTANALLASSPSFKAALNEAALPPQAAPLSKEKHSALVILSKEKIKL